MGALAPGARATETQWWIASSQADHQKSETRGVVVNPDGTLGLGPEATFWSAESVSVVWSLAVLADGSVALGGDRGRILRWTASGGVRPWVRLPVGQVLALAPDGDAVIAGTGPDGLVYRIGARGDTTLLARTGERYVWGVAPAGRAAWWAATGTRGKLLRIDGSRATTVLDSDESNLVSLLPDGRGGVYAGGDSRGRVFHASAAGEVRALFDAVEDEIRALALDADGAVYAAALSASAVSGATDDKPADDEPAPVRSAVSGGRAVVYRILEEQSVATHWTSPHPFLFALLGTPEGVLAATGNRASLHRIEGAGQATALLAAPQGQLTALVRVPGGAVFAATANPAGVWRVGPGRASRGELLSAVQDARRLARFGRVLWRGESHGGRVTLATRSGNTDPPDTTWSAWRDVPAGEPARSESPPGRYFQWRATLAGGNPRIESVEAAWRERNLPPRIDDLVVAPQGQGFREGDLHPRSEPVTQTLPGGQRVEYSAPTTNTPRALRELPMWARGLRTVQWRGSDPNGDELRYRVTTRTEGAQDWVELGKDLETSSFTWDTAALPDGRYRLRVEASDARTNAVGEALDVALTSVPFTIDNTPPVIAALRATGEAGAIRLEGRAEDEFGPLARLEVAVDDGDWRPVTPDEGLTDAGSHAVRVRLPDVPAGDHSVSLRAVDGAGNATLRAVRVSVPTPR
jgi:hypothetical protein